MTYTEHKLTDAMLRRLSPIVNGRKHNHGLALRALVYRELVSCGEPRLNSFGEHSWWVGPYTATDAGREALLRARVEGW